MPAVHLQLSVPQLAVTDMLMVLAIITLILIVCTIVNAIFCMRNFKKGTSHLLRC